MRSRTETAAAVLPAPDQSWLAVLVSVVATLLLVVLGVFLPVDAARADSELVSSTPADGSTVASMPAQIVLTFTDSPATTDSPVFAGSSTPTSTAATPSTALDNVPVGAHTLGKLLYALGGVVLVVVGVVIWAVFRKPKHEEL